MPGTMPAAGDERSKMWSPEEGLHIGQFFKTSYVLLCSQGGTGLPRTAVFPEPAQGVPTPFWRLLANPSFLPPISQFLPFAPLNGENLNE